jgi:paraquat-inducible protein B
MVPMLKILKSVAPFHYLKTSNALAPPDGEPFFIRMHFDQSMRGLAVNAPVEFLGVNIGKVVSTDLDFNPSTNSFAVMVGELLTNA